MPPIDTLILTQVSSHFYPVFGSVSQPPLGGAGFLPSGGSFPRHVDPLSRTWGTLQLCPFAHEYSLYSVLTSQHQGSPSFHSALKSGSPVSALQADQQNQFSFAGLSSQPGFVRSLFVSEDTISGPRARMHQC